MDNSWISAFLASLHKLEHHDELQGLEKFLRLTTITSRHEELKLAIIKTRVRLGSTVKQRTEDQTLNHIEVSRRQAEASPSRRHSRAAAAPRGHAPSTPFVPHTST
jgi:hypothetical protein